MTHRDGFPRFSARSAWRGDAGHRKPCATPSESLGKPPFRSGRRTAGGRRKALTMSRNARGFPPTRRVACPISMGHYQRSLVLGEAPEGDGGFARGIGPGDPYIAQQAVVERGQMAALLVPLLPDQQKR